MKISSLNLHFLVVMLQQYCFSFNFDCVWYSIEYHFYHLCIMLKKCKLYKMGLISLMVLMISMGRHYLFYFQTEQKGGRETSMCGCPSCAPTLGAQPATQACAPTGNRTSDPLVRRLALNPLNHTSQGWVNFFFLQQMVFHKFLSGKHIHGSCLPNKCILIRGTYLQLALEFYNLNWPSPFKRNVKSIRLEQSIFSFIV